MIWIFYETLCSKLINYSVCGFLELTISNGLHLINPLWDETPDEYMDNVTMIYKIGDGNLLVSECINTIMMRDEISQVEAEKQFGETLKEYFFW